MRKVIAKKQFCNRSSLIANALSGKYFATKNFMSNFIDANDGMHFMSNFIDANDGMQKKYESLIILLCKQLTLTIFKGSVH